MVKESKKYMEKQKELSNLFKSHISDLTISPLSSLHGDNSEKFTTNKLSYFLEVNRNKEDLFHNNKKMMDDISRYSIISFRMIFNDERKIFDFNYHKYKSNSAFIELFNKQHLFDWINTKKTFSSFPEFYLFNKEHNDFVKTYFFKNDVSPTSNNTFSVNGRNTFKTMIAINYPLIDELILNNKITGQHLSNITSKIFSSYEENDKTLLSKFYQFSSINENLIRNVVSFNDYVENYLFNLDKILTKYPHLLKDFNISTIFKHYEFCEEDKTLDLFAFRTSAVKSFIQKYQNYCNQSKDNILKFIDYTPTHFKELIASNILINQNIELLFSKKPSIYPSSFTSNIEDQYSNNIFGDTTPFILAHEILSFLSSNIENNIENNIEKIVDKYNELHSEDLLLGKSTSYTQFVRALILSIFPTSHGQKIFDLINTLDPEIESKYLNTFSQEEIHNLSIKGFQNICPLLPSGNNLVQSFYQELRENHLKEHLINHCTTSKTKKKL